MKSIKLLPELLKHLSVKVKLQLLAALFLSLATTISDIFCIVFIVYYLGIITGSDLSLIQNIPNILSPDLLSDSRALFLAIVLRLIFFVGRGYIEAQSIANVAKELMAISFESVINGSYNRFASLNKASFRHTVIMMTYKASNYVRGVLATIFELALLSGMSCIIFWEFGAKSILGLGMIIVAGVVILLSLKRVMLTIGKKLTEAEAACIGTVELTITSFRFLRTSRLASFIINDFKVNATRWASAYANSGIVSTIPRIGLEVLIMVMVIVAFSFNANEFKEHLDTVALITAFLMRLAPSVARVNTAFQAILFANEPTSRLLKFISKPADSHRGSAHPVVLRGQTLEFRDITINEHINLKCDAFDIRQGDKILFLGKSGSGKSLFLDIIIGLTPPKFGQLIEIDDKDDNPPLQNWLLQKVTYCAQNEGLFEGSMRDNIFGMAKNTSDETYTSLINEIIVSCFDKKIHLDSNVVGSGRELSGGQLQIITICRALAQEPKILILDEATSAMDKAKELQVLTLLEKRIPDLTIILVTHNEHRQFAGYRKLKIQDGLVKVSA